MIGQQLVNVVSHACVLHGHSCLLSGVSLGCAGLAIEELGMGGNTMQVRGLAAQLLKLLG